MVAERSPARRPRRGVHPLGLRLRRRCRYRREAKGLRAQIESHKPAAWAPSQPFSREEIDSLLNEDLRSLLNDATEAAAPLLAALVGPIKVVRSPTVTSKGGAAWIGKFTVNAVPVLLELAARRESPSAAAWKFISEHSQTSSSEPVELVFKDGSPSLVS